MRIVIAILDNDDDGERSCCFDIMLVMRVRNPKITYAKEST